MTKSIYKFSSKALAVQFPYDSRLVDEMRKFPVRRWDKESKLWLVSICDDNIEILKNNPIFKKFAWDKKTKELINGYQQKQKDFKKITEQKISNLKIPGLKTKLYPYQLVGVEFIDKIGSCLIADEQGLGKTAQALAWLQLRTKVRPVLVICPATLKLNWEIEVDKWMTKNNSVQVIIAGNKIKDSDILIINYDIVDRYLEKLKKIKFQCIIIDESALIKNIKAKRTKAILKLAKKIPHVLCLSGTPFLNRPVEMFNTLQLISPSAFSNFWQYAFKYCNATKGYWGWNFDGASNTDELANKLSKSIMIRREKKDVLKDLPAKTRVLLPQDVNLSEYNRKEKLLADWIRQNKITGESSGGDHLVKIEKLKQVALKAKYKEFVEWIKDFADMTGQKIVVFVHHREYIDLLLKDLKKFNPVSIVGGDAIQKRQDVIEMFQNKRSHRIIVCSMKAAGVGITLTKASTVAFFELGWNYQEHVQCEDRTHRIGQKDNVTAYYFIAKRTIEEDIYELLESKKKVFDEIMQTSNLIDVKTKDLGGVYKELLNKIINKYDKKGGKKNKKYPSKEQRV